jgi:5-methylcytosine-specific restriction endonuclease McrA
MWSRSRRQQEMSNRYRPGWACPECRSPTAEYHSAGLCKTCYSRAQRRKKGAVPIRGRIRICQGCGEVKRIQGLELCASCYGKKRREIHREELARYDRQKQDRQDFGGNREIVMQRAEGRCEVCGMTDDESLARWAEHLLVHHKDGRGATSGNPNNSIDNLQVLCRPCHKAVHANIHGRVVK